MPGLAPKQLPDALSVLAVRGLGAQATSTLSMPFIRGDPMNPRVFMILMFVIGINPSALRAEEGRRIDPNDEHENHEYTRIHRISSNEWHGQRTRCLCAKSTDSEYAESIRQLFWR